MEGVAVIRRPHGAGAWAVRALSTLGSLCAYLIRSLPVGFGDPAPSPVDYDAELDLLNISPAYRQTMHRLRRFYVQEYRRLSAAKSEREAAQQGGGQS